MIAGAGRRGADEAGALCRAAATAGGGGPAAAAAVGTSAGAINAADLAANLHLGAERATEGLVDLGRSLHRPDLLGPLAITAVPPCWVRGRIADRGSARAASRLRAVPEVNDEAIGDWG